MFPYVHKTLICPKNQLNILQPLCGVYVFQHKCIKANLFYKQFQFIRFWLIEYAAYTMSRTLFDNENFFFSSLKCLTRESQVSVLFCTSHVPDLSTLSHTLETLQLMTSTTQSPNHHTQMHRQITMPPQQTIDSVRY